MSKEESDDRFLQDMKTVCWMVNNTRVFANPFEDFAEAMADCELWAARVVSLVRRLDLF